MKINIKEIPFQEWFVEYKADNTNWHNIKHHPNNFLKRYNISARSADIFPAILHHISTLPVNDDGTGGKIDGIVFAKTHKSDWFYGLLAYLVLASRSKLSNSALTSEAMRPYSPLVPLVLAAHKKFNNIPYSNWDSNTLMYLVPKDLVDAMRFSKHDLLRFQGEKEAEWFDNNMSLNEEANEQAELNISEYTTGFHTLFSIDKETQYGFDLADLREFQRLMATNSKGKLHNTKTNHQVFTTGDYVFDHMPKYVRIMACQTWLAHPHNRNEYMILSPRNWDSKPKDLIDTGIFEEAVPKTDEVEEFFSI